MPADKAVTVISTGSREIDDKMGGGVPHGSMTLIEGDSHSGKSVLTQQMSWGSLHDGFRLSFFTTENTVKSLVKQMDSLNIDILDYLLLGRLRLFAMEISQSRGQTMDVLLQAVKNEGRHGSDMIFVDALTPMITASAPEAVLAFFEKCKRLCSEGMTIVLVVHSHAVDKELLVRITSLCDAHLRLRTEEVGERLIKAMEVAKVRGASKRTGNIVSFEVEPGFGMRIIPINKAQG
jgi:flagellar protein FlaH